MWGLESEGLFLLSVRHAALKRDLQTILFSEVTGLPKYKNFVGIEYEHAP